MQNTIVKEFENNPNVFVAVFNQGGRNGETRAWLEDFWSHYYLRGGVLFDVNGDIGSNLWGQPQTHLPFFRGFIIDPDGWVIKPYFGHHPQMVIDQIYELLGTSGIAEQEIDQPLRLELSGPNPFNRRTGVTYTLIDGGLVDLNVYDQLGRRICNLEKGWFDPGHYTSNWDGRANSGKPVGNGVYFISLDSDQRFAKQTVIVVR